MADNGNKTNTGTSPLSVNEKGLVWRKSLLVILIATIVLIVLFLLLFGSIRYGSLFAGFWIFSALIEGTDVYGVNVWLVRMVAIPISLIFLIGALQMLSWRSRRRLIGIFMIASGMVLYYLGVYILEKDAVYGVNDQLRQCIALDKERVRYQFVPCTWQRTPWGTAVNHKPAPELIALVQNQDNPPPTIDRFIPNERTVFVHPDGTVRVWYYRDQEGRLEFYLRPGTHPQLPSLNLQPVNDEIARQFLDYWQREKRYMIIGTPEYEEALTRKNKPKPFARQEVKSGGEPIPEASAPGLNSLKEFLNEIRGEEKGGSK